MSAKVSPRCLMGLVLTGILLVSALLGWERALGGMPGGGAMGRGHMGKEVYYGSPEIGKKLFAARGCSACHAVRGVGGRLGPDLGKEYHAHNVFDMSAKFWNHSPTMLKAMAEMKLKWPKFEEGDLAHIISYLHSPEVIGDPETGKRVFVEKGCATCHAIKGVGGKIAPDLVSGPHPHTQLDFVTAMWNHFPHMVPMMEAMKIQKLEFKQEEMADLLAYLVQASKAHH